MSKDTVFNVSHIQQNASYTITIPEGIFVFCEDNIQIDNIEYVIPTIKFDKNYKIIEIIGKGKSSEVYKVIRRTDNKIFAIKMSDADTGTNIYINEYEIIRYLMSKYSKLIDPKFHLIEFYDIMYLDINDSVKIGILMEYIEGKPLDKLNINSEQMIPLLFDLVKTLDFLHSNNVVHRDIKKDNVIISNDHLILIDFGFSNITEKASGMKGTPYYLSPELINKVYNFDKERALKASDIWAVGILFYILVNGQTPWKSKNLPLLKSEILRVNPKTILPTPDLSNLINSMLIRDYRKRQTAVQILETLNKMKETPIN